MGSMYRSINSCLVTKAEEVAHASRNVMNFLPFSTPEGSRCRLIPVLSGLQECNYVALQYKQVMTRAQPPLLLRYATYKMAACAKRRRVTTQWTLNGALMTPRVVRCIS